MTTWHTFGALALIFAAVPTAGAASLTYEAALMLAMARSLDARRAALAIELATVDRAFVDYETDPLRPSHLRRGARPLRWRRHDPLMRYRREELDLARRLRAAEISKSTFGPRAAVTIIAPNPKAMRRILLVRFDLG